MKNKIMIIFLAGILSTIVFLSACGGNDTDSNTNEQNDTEGQLEDNGTADSDTGDNNTEEKVDTSENNENTDEETENGDEQIEEEDPQSEPQVVLENDAFRVFEPEENAVVGNEFTVRGEARVFEANILYEFEDGHNILDEGFVTASVGAPEWGEFEITISFDEVAYENGTVILYEEDAKDGSRKNELYIPVTVQK